MRFVRFRRARRPVRAVRPEPVLCVLRRSLPPTPETPNTRQKGKGKVPRTHSSALLSSVVTVELTSEGETNIILTHPAGHFVVVDSVHPTTNAWFSLGKRSDLIPKACDHLIFAISLDSWQANAIPPSS